MKAILGPQVLDSAANALWFNRPPFRKATGPDLSKPSSDFRLGWTNFKHMSYITKDLPGNRIEFEDLLIALLRQGAACSHATALGHYNTDIHGGTRKAD